MFKLIEKLSQNRFVYFMLIGVFLLAGFASAYILFGDGSRNKLNEEEDLFNPVLIDQDTVPQFNPNLVNTTVASFPQTVGDDGDTTEQLKVTLSFSDINTYVNTDYKINFLLPNDWKTREEDVSNLTKKLVVSNDTGDDVFEIVKKKTSMPGGLEYSGIKRTNWPTKAGIIKLKEFYQDGETVFGAADMAPAGYLRYYKTLSDNEKFILTTFDLNSPGKFVSKCFINEACTSTNYYQNDVLKFKIQIPEGWGVNERTTDGVYTVQIIKPDGQASFDIQEIFIDSGAIAYEKINRFEISTKSGTVKIKEFLDRDRVIWANGNLQPSGQLFYYDTLDEDEKGILKTFETLRSGNFSVPCYIYDPCVY